MTGEADPLQAASTSSIGAQIGTVTTGRDFFLNLVLQGQNTAPLRPVGLSPHSQGGAIQKARNALGLSQEELVARSRGAFDLVWLKAAEEGARVEARQLGTLASLLKLQPADVTLEEDQRPPYRGLLAFEPEDALLFGGREAATIEILDLIDQHPIVLVIGASGSGKSSVVKAGVVPELAARRAPSWRGLILRPGSDPLLALARALGSELDHDADEDTRLIKARKRAAILSNHKVPLADYLDRIAKKRTETASPPPRLLLFVDQWEELYTQTEEESRRAAFVAQLTQAFAKGPHRLILTMRADFMGSLLDHDRPFFDAAKPGLMPLPRMSTGELAEAIRKPAEATGLSFEAGLVEAILESAGSEPGMLALVEFTLTELWKSRDKTENCMTLAAYHALGGLNGAIDRHATQVFNRLKPEQKSAARRALTQLVHVSTLDTYTRTRKPLSDLDDNERRVLRSLAEQDNRLVVVSHDTELGGDVAEVAHESLIREWKTLNNWIAQDPRFLQWREEVDRRRRRYEKNGFHPEDLLQGSDLEEAKGWLVNKGFPKAEKSSDNHTGDGPIDITEAVLGFVNLSNERQIRLNTSKQRRLMSFLAFFVFIAFSLLYLMYNFISANISLNSNIIDAITFQSQQMNESGEYDTALLLAATAIQKSKQNLGASNEGAEAAALRALNANRLLKLISADGVTSVAVDQVKNKAYYTCKTCNNLRTLDLITFSNIAWKEPTDLGGKLALSADGNTLVKSNQKEISIYNTETGALVESFVRPDGKLHSLDVSSDGERIVLGIFDESGNSFATVYDVVKKKYVSRSPSHKGFITGVAFSLGGKFVISGSYGGSLLRWNAETGASVEDRSSNATVVAVQASVYGAIVMASFARKESIAVFFDEEAKSALKLNSPLADEIRAPEIIQSARLSHDGSYLITASSRSSARVTSFKDSNKSEKLIHPAGVQDAWSFDLGKSLISLALDGKLRIWNIENATGQKSIDEAGGGVTVARWVRTEDGSAIVVAGHSGGTKIVSPSGGRPLEVENAGCAVGPGCPPLSVSVSGDGNRVLVSRAGGKKVYVYDIKAKSIIWSRDVDNYTSYRTVISNDGDRIYAIDNNSNFEAIRVADGSIAWKDNVKNLASQGLWLWGGVSIGDRDKVLAYFDGQYIAVRGSDGGSPSRVTSDLNRPFRDVGVSPDGKYVAVAVADNSVTLVSLHPPHTIRSLVGMSAWPVGFEFSRDGRYLGATSEFEHIVWDVSSGEVAFKQLSKLPTSISFFDGSSQIILVGDQGKIKLVPFRANDDKDFIDTICKSIANSRHDFSDLEMSRYRFLEPTDKTPCQSSGTHVFGHFTGKVIKLYRSAIEYLREQSFQDKRVPTAANQSEQPT